MRNKLILSFIYRPVYRPAIAILTLFHTCSCEHIGRTLANPTGTGDTQRHLAPPCQNTGCWGHPLKGRCPQSLPCRSCDWRCRWLVSASSQSCECAADCTYHRTIELIMLRLDQCFYYVYLFLTLSFIINSLRRMIINDVLSASRKGFWHWLHIYPPPGYFEKLLNNNNLCHIEPEGLWNLSNS